MFLYVHSQGIQPEIMHGIADFYASCGRVTPEGCNKCEMLRCYLSICAPPSLPTAPFLLHHNTTTFRCFVTTLFYYKGNHDFILYLKRRVVDDLMTSSSTRKICFDSQKVVRYLVETTHYDVRKGNICLLQTYITSV